jgi:hypothetical protein
VPDCKRAGASNGGAFHRFFETKIFGSQRVVPVFSRNRGPMPGFGQNLRARIALEFEKIVIKRPGICRPFCASNVDMGEPQMTPF